MERLKTSPTPFFPLLFSRFYIRRNKWKTDILSAPAPVPPLCKYRAKGFMSEWLPSPSALAVGRTKKTERQGEKEPMLFERSEFIGSRPAA
jgi:hypothetical protein